MSKTKCEHDYLIELQYLWLTKEVIMRKLSRRYSLRTKTCAFLDDTGNLDFSADYDDFLLNNAEARKDSIDLSKVFAEIIAVEQKLRILNQE